MEKTTLELLREAAGIMLEIEAQGAFSPQALRDRAKQWLENAPLSCLGLPENPSQIPLEGV